METIYIKKSVEGHFVTLPEPLDAELYDNIGSSIEDYDADKWVELSADQIAFRAANPAASVTEVWAMELTAPRVRTLEEAIAFKRRNIDLYDQSDAVNSFTLSGREMWLDKATRVGLANSIGIEESAGRTETTLWFGDIRYVLPIADAKRMLAALELYALECYNVTAAHKAAVGKLESVEAVDGYDHTSGYPSRLDFNPTADETA